MRGPRPGNRGHASLGGGRGWKLLRPDRKFSGKFSGKSGAVFELGGERRFSKTLPSGYTLRGVPRPGNRGRASLGGGYGWRGLRPHSKLGGKLKGKNGVVFELRGERRSPQKYPDIF